MRILKQLRIEDLVAIIVFYFSIKMSSTFYYIVSDNIAISRHLIAIIILVLFAITTSIYRIRKRIIVDSIKSEVELPRLTIKDELIETWKKRHEILMVIRDYLPFLIILVSYYNILKNTPSITEHPIFRTPESLLSIANFIKETLAQNFFLKKLANLSYSTHIISVPILASYMYLLKTQRMFRRLLLAISISAITGILIAKTSQLGIFHISMPVCFTTIVLIYAGKVSKPVTHVFLPIATFLLAMDITINIPYLSTTIAGVLNAIAAIFFSDTMIKTEYKLRRRFFG